MGRTVTYGIEVLVGLACLGLGLVTWRHPGALRIAAIAFILAGVAAVAHAVVELVQ